VCNPIPGGSEIAGRRVRARGLHRSKEFWLKKFCKILTGFNREWTPIHRTVDWQKNALCEVGGNFISLKMKIVNTQNGPLRRRVYQDMRNIFQNGNTYGPNDPTQIANPTDAGWQGIEGAVRTFVSFGANREVNITESVSGLQITRRSLGDKIRLLFPGFQVRDELDNTPDEALTADEIDLKHVPNVTGHPYGTYRSFSTPKGAQLLMDSSLW
jgi:hypothetical protein